MLKSIQPYDSIVHLVPVSGIQMLDFGIAARSMSGESGRFISYRESGSDSEEDFSVAYERLELSDNDDDSWVGTRSGGVFGEDDAEASFSAVAHTLAVFDGQWLPIPFLRSRGVASGGEDLLDNGPTTWARARVIKLGEPDEAGNNYRAQIAFDTDIAPAIEGRPYTAPTPDDSRRGQLFRLSPVTGRHAWFAEQLWVREWVEQLAQHSDVEISGAFGDEDFDDDADKRPDWWSIALYCDWIEILSRTCQPPDVKLVDIVSIDRNYTPIDVDLVLDIGNSRTYGLLVEMHDGSKTLGDSFPVELRDLSAPEFSYSEPFESRVEFAQTSFGTVNEQSIRKSFRTQAFDWPSLLRVGFEAARLNGMSEHSRGTGMSSPKRYLWDFAPSRQVWRFNSSSDELVQGSILDYLTDDGYVQLQLELQIDKEKAASRQQKLKKSARLRQAAREQGLGPAFSANFSRSNIYIQMLAEILLHALVQINSVRGGSFRKHPTIPRRLRRVIVTIPPATPLPERTIMAEHVQAAVMLVWQSLGWDEKPAWMEHRPNIEPEVWTDWDEATCTQIVFLYFEIAVKHRLSIEDYCRAMQLRPSDDGVPRIKLASIDLGGGTTDLMIISYRADGDALMPTQEFREGFKRAGDDILERIIARHVLPAIVEALESAGLGQARSLVSEWVAGDRGDQAEAERLLRRRFVSSLCMPFALRIMQEYEKHDPLGDSSLTTIGFDTLLSASPPGLEAVTGRLKDLLLNEHGVKFDFAEIVANVDFLDIDKTVESVLAGPLQDLCQIIRHLDCDYLLVSGRPSRLPRIESIIINTNAVPSDRVVAMGRYRAGNQYPFRHVDGRIRDPKTTVAVGAMLALLSMHSIKNFKVKTEELRMKSTARFVGRLEFDGKIKRENELFADVDEDTRDDYSHEEEGQLNMNTVTPIGFRQLPLERWTATPLYMLEFGREIDPSKLKLPLTVTIKRNAPPLGEDDETVKEEFVITHIQEHEGPSHDLRDKSVTRQERAPVVRRLHTLGEKYEYGYWLDTGKIDWP